MRPRKGAIIAWPLLAMFGTGLVLRWFVIGDGTSLMAPRSHAALATHQRRRSAASKPQPHQHVYYLKTHLTDNNPLSAILGEYCRTHDLIPLLPQGSRFNQNPPLKDEHISFLDNKTFNYDMVFNQHVFDSKMLSFLYNDTFTMTMLQRPYDNFIATFKHSNISYLNRIRGKIPVLKFLYRPQSYDVGGYKSLTNNRQSMDLGYNLSHSFSDVKYIRKFIEEVDNRFHLVLITEYFDEGLIILKRLLKWNTEDILYITGDLIHEKVVPPQNRTLLENAQRNYHYKMSKADIMLYGYFYMLFQQRMALEIGLGDEVDEFQIILGKVKRYCSGSADKKGHLKILKGKWTNGFRMPPHKCKWLKMNDVSMTYYLKSTQHAMMDDWWWKNFYHKHEEEIYKILYPPKVHKQ